MNVEKLIAEICELESGHGDVYTHIRTKVLVEGKKLRALQKWQKAEQKAAKERGETPQTWKEFVSEQQKATGGLFPSRQMGNRYMRISQYPGAYEKGMSIKEAYKNATAWKNNGGNPPPKAKVSIQNRLPARVGAACSRLVKSVEKWNDIEDWTTVVDKEGWTEDEFKGLEESIREAKREIGYAWRKLKAAEKQFDLY